MALPTASVASHHDGPQRVGENVAEQDPAAPGAEAAGGLHVGGLPDGQDLAPHHPGGGHPAQQPDDDGHGAGAGLGEGGQHDEQGKGGDGVGHVGEAHEEVVHPPAIVAAQGAHSGPHSRAHHRGQHPDEQAHPPAVEDPGEEVAAQVVGTHPVVQGGRLADAGEVDGVEVVPGQEGRGHARRGHKQDHHHRGHRQAVSAEAGPEQSPSGLLLPRGALDGRRGHGPFTHTGSGGRGRRRRCPPPG